MFKKFPLSTTLLIFAHFNLSSIILGLKKWKNLVGEAVFAKQAEMIALELSEKDENTGETALHILAKEGKVGILKHLLKNEEISDDIVR